MSYHSMHNLSRDREFLGANTLGAEASRIRYRGARGELGISRHSYGNQGYWRKSGGRLSRNACLPSAPSSVM
jgi:hypothetical protein